MARGYLGKISAIVSANTGNYVRGLDESARRTAAFAKTIQSDLRNASRDASKSIDGILTPLQRVERALQNARSQRLSFRGFEGAIRTVEDLRKRIGSLELGDRELAVRVSGLSSIAALNKAIEGLKQEDIDLAVRVGGVDGIRRLRQEVKEVDGQVINVETKRSAENLDLLIDRFQVLSAQRIQQVQIAVETAQLDRAETAFKRTVSVAQQIAAPLGAAVQQVTQLSAEVQTAFGPALQVAQRAVENLNKTIENGGRITDNTFERTSQRVDQTTQAIRRLSEASKIAASASTGVELGFTAPGVQRELTASAAARNAAAGVVDPSRFAPQVQQLSQLNDLIVEYQATVEQRKVLGLDTTQAQDRLDKLLLTTQRARAGLEGQLSDQNRSFTLAQAPRPQRGLGLFGSQVGTDEEQALARARTVSAEFEKLPLAAQAGLRGLAGIASNVANGVQAGTANAVQLNAVLDRFVGKVTDAKNATREFTLVQAPRPQRGLGLFGSQVGTDEEQALARARTVSAEFEKLPLAAQAGLRGLAGIASNVANGVQAGTANAVQLNAVLDRFVSRVAAIETVTSSVTQQISAPLGAAVQKLTTLSAGVQTAFGPALQAAQQSVENLNKTIENGGRITDNTFDRSTLRVERTTQAIQRLAVASEIASTAARGFELGFAEPDFRVQRELTASAATRNAAASAFDPSRFAPQVQQLAQLNDLIVEYQTEVEKSRLLGLDTTQAKDRLDKILLTTQRVREELERRLLIEVDAQQAQAAIDTLRGQLSQLSAGARGELLPLLAGLDSRLGTIGSGSKGLAEFQKQISAVAGSFERVLAIANRVEKIDTSAVAFADPQIIDLLNRFAEAQKRAVEIPGAARSGNQFSRLAVDVQNATKSIELLVARQEASADAGDRATIQGQINLETESLGRLIAEYERLSQARSRASDNLGLSSAVQGFDLNALSEASVTARQAEGNIRNLNAEYQKFLDGLSPSSTLTQNLGRGDVLSGFAKRAREQAASAFRDLLPKADSLRRRQLIELAVQVTGAESIDQLRNATAAFAAELAGISASDPFSRLQQDAASLYKALLPLLEPRELLSQNTFGTDIQKNIGDLFINLDRPAAEFGKVLGNAIQQGLVGISGTRDEINDLIISLQTAKSVADIPLDKAVTISAKQLESLRNGQNELGRFVEQARALNDVGRQGVELAIKVTGAKDLNDLRAILGKSGEELDKLSANDWAELLANSAQFATDAFRKLQGEAERSQKILEDAGNAARTIGDGAAEAFRPIESSSAAATEKADLLFDALRRLRQELESPNRGSPAFKSLELFPQLEQDIQSIERRIKSLPKDLERDAIEATQQFRSERGLGAGAIESESDARELASRIRERQNRRVQGLLDQAGAAQAGAEVRTIQINAPLKQINEADEAVKSLQERLGQVADRLDGGRRGFDELVDRVTTAQKAIDSLGNTPGARDLEASIKRIAAAVRDFGGSAGESREAIRRSLEATQVEIKALESQRSEIQRKIESDPFAGIGPGAVDDGSDALLAQTERQLDELRQKASGFIDQLGKAPSDQQILDFISDLLRETQKVEDGVERAKVFNVDTKAAEDRVRALDALLDSVFGSENISNINALEQSIQKLSLANQLNLGDAVQEFRDAIASGKDYEEQLKRLLAIQDRLSVAQAIEALPEGSDARRRLQERFDREGTGPPPPGTPPLPADIASAQQRTDLFGLPIEDSVRRLGVLQGALNSVKGRVDQLPIPLQASFVPLLAEAEAEMLRLVASGSATERQLAAAAARVDQLATGARRAADSVSLLSAGDALERIATREAVGQLDAAARVLAEIGAQAGGPAAQAYERLRAAQQRFIAEGTSGTPAARREIRLLQEDLARAAAETGRISFSRALREIQRGGDIGRRSFSNLGLGIQQVAFIVDDFFSVTGGIEQRLRAIGNNISQFGFIVGGTYGLVAGVAASIGAQAAVALIKWSNAGRSTEDQAKALNSVLSRQKTLVEELANAFSTLGQQIVSRGFSPAADAANELADRLREIARLQREAAESSLSSTSQAVGNRRADQDIIRQRLESEANVGRRIALARRLAEAERNERETAQRFAAGRATPLRVPRNIFEESSSSDTLANQPVGGAVPSGRQIASLFERIAGEALDGVSRRNLLSFRGFGRQGIVESLPAILGGSGSTAPEFTAAAGQLRQFAENLNLGTSAEAITAQAAAIEQAVELFKGAATRTFLGFNTDASNEASEFIRVLGEVRARILAGVNRDIDRDITAIAGAADRASRVFADLQQAAQEAIERGVVGSESIAAGVDAAQAAIKRSTTAINEVLAGVDSQGRPVERTPEQIREIVNREQASIEQLRRQFPRVAVDSQTLQSRLGRVVGGERASAALQSLSGAESFANEYAGLTAQLQRAVELERIARERFSRSNDAQSVAALAAARAASDLAAAAAEAALAIDTDFARLRQAIDSTLQASQQAAADAQRRVGEAGGFGGRPLADLERERDRAQANFLGDRSRLGQLRDQLAVDRAVALQSPEVQRINQRLEAIRNQREAAAERARITGQPEDIRTAARLSSEQTRLENERTQAVDRLTAATRRAIEAENQAITQRERQAEFLRTIQEQLFPTGDPVQGLDALRTPAERVGVQLQQQFANIDAAVAALQGSVDPRDLEQRRARSRRRAIEDITDLGLSDQRKFARGLEDNLGLVQAQAEGFLGLGDRQAALDSLNNSQRNLARQNAPLFAQFSDEVANAVLQGPSRAALQVSDASTTEGQRELNRLLRGEDSARDVNFLELQKQSTFLQSIDAGIAGLRQQLGLAQ